MIFMLNLWRKPIEYAKSKEIKKLYKDLVGAS